jgi:hypothetical protein
MLVVRHEDSLLMQSSKCNTRVPASYHGLTTASRLNSPLAYGGFGHVCRRCQHQRFYPRTCCTDFASLRSSSKNYGCRPGCRGCSAGCRLRPVGWSAGPSLGHAGPLLCGRVFFGDRLVPRRVEKRGWSALGRRGELLGTCKTAGDRGGTRCQAQRDGSATDPIGEPSTWSGRGRSWGA